MTSDNTVIEISGPPTPNTHHSAHVHKPKSGGVLFLLFFIVAVTCGGFYWLWKTNEGEKLETERWRETLSQRLDASEKIHNDEIRALNAHIDSVSGSVAEISSRFGTAGRDLIIAETSYILKIANYRLLLDRDQGTALLALKLADSKLRAISDPAFVETRQVLAKEITALENMTLPDFTGMSIALNEMAEHIGPMLRKRPKLAPVTTENVEPAQADDTSVWQRAVDTIWAALKDLFVIRHHDANVMPLLSPEQGEYLSLNLQLKVDQARLALAQRNDALFHANLQQIQNWITRYFDTESVAVKSVLDKLTQWQSINIAPELPDISASLRSLEKSAKKVGFALLPDTFIADAPPARGQKQ